MAKKPILILKEYFQTGKKPTESQFADLIDSFAHLDGPQIAKLIENIQTTGAYLQLTNISGALIAQISLDDIRRRTNEATDKGWENPNLINGASNYENGHQTVRVKKRNGVVYLEGMLRTSNNSSYVAFILQKDYWPKEILTFNCISKTGAKKVEINPVGEVRIDFVNTDWLSLGGINYLLE